MSGTAGVDEAGRGPLAGPVVAAAVILRESNPISGLADSKKLNPRRREMLFVDIKNHARAVGIGVATHLEIDELNILHASLLAMQRAVADLRIEPDNVLCDGNRCPQLAYPVEAIIGGDGSVPCISAASIIAKVTRDRIMIGLAEKYPQYGFDQHKGYPTKAHREALLKFGPIDEHRRSFAPVRQCIE